MTESYWHIKDKVMIGQRSRQELPDRADVVVIGAGLVGIATAYYLRRMGCNDVIVLEKNFVGYGASGRNAGFLLSGMAEPYSRLVVGLGPENAKLLTAATVENHELIAEAIANLKIDCDYQRSGSYHLAVSPIEAGELRDSVELLRADGFDGDFIEAAELCDRMGFGNYAGASFNPGDGNLDPFAFVNGLVEETVVVENFEVSRIEKRAAGIEISSGDRSIRSEMAVLATNAYSPLVDHFFKRLIFPVRGQMIATSSGETRRLPEKVFYANFGYDYFRQTPENTLLMGGLRNRFTDTEVGFEDTANPDIQRALEEYICDNIGFKNIAVKARWSGIMGNTIDGLPLVGPLPHNGAVIAAVGYNGHGFGLGMIVARDVAGAISGGQNTDLLRKFSLKRFA